MTDKRVLLNVGKRIPKPNGAYTEYRAGHYYTVPTKLADAWIAEETAEEPEKIIEPPRSVPDSEPLLHDEPTIEDPE